MLGKDHKSPLEDCYEIMFYLGIRRDLFHWQEYRLYSNTAEVVGFIQQFLGLSKNAYHLCFLSFFPWKQFTDLRSLGTHCLSYFYVILSCSVISSKGLLVRTQLKKDLIAILASAELLDFSRAIVCLTDLLIILAMFLLLQRYAFY